MVPWSEILRTRWSELDDPYEFKSNLKSAELRKGASLRLNHQDGSKSVSRFANLIKRSKQHFNSPIGPSYQAHPSHNMRNSPTMLGCTLSSLDPHDHARPNSLKTWPILDAQTWPTKQTMWLVPLLPNMGPTIPLIFDSQWISAVCKFQALATFQKPNPCLGKSLQGKHLLNLNERKYVSSWWSNMWQSLSRNIQVDLPCIQFCYSFLLG